MILLSLAVAAMAAWLLLPTISDFVSIVVVLGRRDRARASNEPSIVRFIILVPAHDEATVIGRCLDSLNGQTYEDYDVVVVADNCTDATADIVRAAGVTCLERSDPTSRGKPHALGWAMSQLDLDSADCLTIVDADCVLDRDYLAALAKAGANAAVAIQPFNGVMNSDANSLTHMAAVLSEALHGVAFRLKAAAGRNVPLSAGMCLGTDLVRAHGWRAFSLGEDWETHARLTVEGQRVLGAPRARLAALEAADLGESEAQRRRWTLGKLWVLRSFAGAILRSRRIGIGQKIDALAELSQPGPALHLGLVILLCALLVLTRPPGTGLLVVLIAASLARFIAYTTIATLRQPRPLRSLAAFGFLPIYVVWRLVIVARHLGGGWGGGWIRTGRQAAERMPVADRYKSR